MAQNAISDRSGNPAALTTAEMVAFVGCMIWMLGVGLFFLLSSPADMTPAQAARLHWILMVVAALMPVGLVWVAVMGARSARIMRAEAFRVQTAINDLRRLQQAQKAATAPVSGAPSRPAQAVAPQVRTPRAAPQATPEQPALALEGSAAPDVAPMPRADLVKALNFPDDEHDRAGFAALRGALHHRGARKLVHASQDVLTLLSQNGVYTDDLQPAPVAADLWRRFAQGERGASIAELGAIHDEAAIAKAATRMREDMIFRDTVHHFLRCFDEMLVDFADGANDAELLALAQTRTARGFMLLARTSGTFG